MAFELITGHAGRNHVDSADMGEAFAGIVGKGRYILDTGEGMACSMADSNTLTVGTGSMLMDGRIVRNETAATFKIANGTQGQYRHDLACLRYKLDRSNDSIESVEQVVLQGTPATTASEAKDPEYEAGDILSGDLSATVPIARVKIDNLTPTCEALLGSVTSLKSLGESVSPSYLGGGNVSLLGCTVKVGCWIAANLILIVGFSYVSGSMSSSDAYEGASNAALVLPERLRPKSNIIATAFTSERFGKSVSAMVEPSGAVKLYFSTRSRIAGYGFENCACLVPLAI